LGKDGSATNGGAKVILENFTIKRIDAATIGIKPGDPNHYNVNDVKRAQQMTSSGDIIHGAPWTGGSQGSASVSHGLVGTSLAKPIGITTRACAATPSSSPRTARHPEARQRLDRPEHQVVGLQGRLSPQFTPTL
jgi:hypothetical protein